MAEAAIRSSGRGRQQPSRLQRRAPASIQIIPVTDWKAAIPLLSPLITSPKNDLTVDIKSNNNNTQRHSNSNKVAEPEKPMVFKKWQHPAAPFCYEPAPLMAFVCSAAD